MSLPKEKIYLGYENSCEFQDICRLYPPLVGDIVKIGYDEFRYYRSLLTTSRDEIADLCMKQHIEEIPTPLQYLIILAQNEDILKIIEKAFQFFIHDKVYILDDYIVIGNILEKHLLTEQNFEDFQNCIRELIGDKPLEKEEADIDPRLARMKAKQRERDRIKAKQSQSKVNYEFSTLMLATCCLGVGVTIWNIKDLPYAAMMKINELMANKDKYETDVASLIAGADSKQINLEYWVKD